MTPLETNRLIISEADKNDSSFFFQLLNSPNWIKFIGDRGIETEKDAVHYIENSLIKSYRENGFGLYKVSMKKNGLPIGLCGFVQREYLNCPDIGFAILPAYERKGFISEAAKSVLEYGINTLGFTEICGVTTEENQASRKILRRVGLNEIGKIMTKDKKELILFSTMLESKAH